MEVKMGPWAVGKCAGVIDVCMTGYRNLSPVELVLIDLRVFFIELVLVRRLMVRKHVIGCPSEAK